MITKFKLFESQTEQIYWKVLIDNNFFVSLDKIGMSEEIQKLIYEHLIDIPEHKDLKFVLVGKEDYGGKTFDWHWNFHQIWKEGDAFYADNHLEDKYEYQGEVNVTPEDIEDWKLRRDAKKYNL